MHDLCPLHSNHAANKKTLRPGQTPRAAGRAPRGKSAWYRLAARPATSRALGPAGQPSFPASSLPGAAQPPQPEPHPLPSGSAPATLGPPRSSWAGPRRERACALAAGRLPGRDLAKLRSAGPRLTGGRAGGGRASVVGREARSAGLAPVLCGILEVSSVSSPARCSAPLRPALADTVAHPRGVPSPPPPSPARDKKSRRQERG